jgi:hypothetical protein
MHNDWNYKDSGFINRNECISCLNDILGISKDILETYSNNQLQELAIQELAIQELTKR